MEEFKIMKKLGLVYFGELDEVNGVSIVVKLFKQGKSLFESNEIDLVRIYSKNKVDNCEFKTTEKKKELNSISNWLLANRFIRTRLRRILNSEIPIFAWIKFQINLMIPAAKVISSIKNDISLDCLIFHDIFTAYYYVKRKEKNAKKTILVLHCEKDIKGQLKINFPGLFKSRKYSLMIDKLFNLGINGIDQLVFVSKTVTEHNLITFPNATFVHNGMENLSKLEMNEKTFSDKLRIISVGSLNFRKGQEIILEAINCMPLKFRKKIEISLVGAGPQMVELNKYLESHNLSDSVKILGNRSDVNDLLNLHDVIVLMSRDEGLPLSLIEGIRAGLYVVSTDVGGVSEIVDSSFGKLISRNADELARTLIEILDNKLVNIESSNSAKLHFEKWFTLDKMINNYSELINSK